MSAPFETPQQSSTFVMVLRKWWWLAALVLVTVAGIVIGVATIASKPSALDLQNEALARCSEEPWASRSIDRFGDCTDNEKYWTSLTPGEQNFVTSMQNGPLKGTGLEAVDLLGEAQVLCDETRDLGGEVVRLQNDQIRGAARSLDIRVDRARAFVAYARQYQCADLVTDEDRAVMAELGAARASVQDQPSQTTAATLTPAPSSATASSDSDRRFLAAAGAGSLRSEDQESYVMEANAVCQYRMHGKSNPDMTTYLGNALGLDMATADAVRVAAITTYCPNYLY
jgi:hypothetical protein